MAEEGSDDSQKTEEPTPKKLEEARKRGQVALSREVNNWIMLFTGMMIMIFLAPSFMSGMIGFLRGFLEHSSNLEVENGGLSTILWTTVTEVVNFLFLPLLILVIASMLGPVTQIGFLFSSESLKPSLNKISVINGLQRLFSIRSVTEFLKGLLKLCIIGFIGYLILLPFYDSIEHFVGIPVVTALDELRYIFIKLSIGILAVLIVVAAIDLFYQRFEYNKKMRMSLQEIKDEYKQSEGDPHVRARLRQLRAEKARARMMQSVPEADVVITNPTHYAIALKYDMERMNAPVLIAKGVDEVAKRIREVAKEHDIVVYESPPLARALYATVEIDEMIPAEHYKAVAEIISYVFRLKGKLPQKG